MDSIFAACWTCRSIRRVSVTSMPNERVPVTLSACRMTPLLQTTCRCSPVLETTEYSKVPGFTRFGEVLQISLDLGGMLRRDHPIEPALSHDLLSGPTGDLLGGAVEDDDVQGAVETHHEDIGVLEEALGEGPTLQERALGGGSGTEPFSTLCRKGEDPLESRGRALGRGQGA